jgi:hypothetical protein
LMIGPASSTRLCIGLGVLVAILVFWCRKTGLLFVRL